MARKKHKIKKINLKNLEGKLVIVKIGDEDRPAMEQDLKDAVKIMKIALKGTKCRFIVTHHAFNIEIV